jgi:hypothetical protein
MQKGCHASFQCQIVKKFSIRQPTQSTRLANFEMVIINTIFLPLLLKHFLIRSFHRWLNFCLWPWRLGIVVIVFAIRTEVRGFEYSQGVGFLGLYKLQCCSLKIDSQWYCERNIFICKLKTFLPVYTDELLYVHTWLILMLFHAHVPDGLLKSRSWLPSGPIYKVIRFYQQVSEIEYLSKIWTISLPCALLYFYSYAIN